MSNFLDGFLRCVVKGLFIVLFLVCEVGYFLVYKPVQWMKGVLKGAWERCRRAAAKHSRRLRKQIDAEEDCARRKREEEAREWESFLNG